MSLAYVIIGSNDTARARAYYDAVLPLLGAVLAKDFMPQGFMYALRDGGRIGITRPYDGWTATPGNGNTVGLLCRSEEEVQVAHAAALANGGTNEGSPGPRPQYGQNFYGAYVRDPDGNKTCFVYYGEIPA
ncbi:MAG: VOC family protein [Stenotrophomonas sp.]|uniref:VOC family protein n=1 Tax=Stenotrophomonas sp. TaxID=69392 RepID=UPI003D6C9744